MERLIYRVSAFSHQNRGGNEAGVVLNTENLDDKTMQSIAKKVGFSETAFVFPSKEADYHLRYFSPLLEVPLCGHATIATFNLMRNLDLLDKQELTIKTAAGILNVFIESDAVFMQMASPMMQEGPDKQELIDSLKLKHSTLGEAPVKIVSTGIEEIFVEIKDKDSLNTLNLDPLAVQKLCEKYDASGMYLFTFDTDDPAATTQGRNFLPVLGIPEESATGTASGALAYYLHTLKLKSQTDFVFEQGSALMKPSRIYAKLTLEKNKIADIKVGGGMRFIDKIINANT